MYRINLLTKTNFHKCFEYLLKNKNILFFIKLKRFSTSSNESFLNGTSANFVEDVYKSWKQNPSSVHTVRSLKTFPSFSTLKCFKSWDTYFKNATGALPSTSSLPAKTSSISPARMQSSSASAASNNLSEVNDAIIEDHLAVQAIIRSYQVKLLSSKYTNIKQLIIFRVEDI